MLRGSVFALRKVSLGKIIIPSSTTRNIQNILHVHPQSKTWSYITRRYLCAGKDSTPENKNQSSPEKAKVSSGDAGTTATKSTLGSSTQQAHQVPPVSPDGKKKPETPPHPQTIASNIGSNISSTINMTHQMYDEFERGIMEKIHYKNQQRFRGMLAGTVLLITWLVAVFGSEMRKYFTEQTAGLAMETLENESLKIQTQELATAVVQTILENKDITAHAAAFLKEASTVPETQQAMLKLTLHILQHKETLEELTKLSQKLIHNLAHDQETVNELARLFERVLGEPELRAALVMLVGQLCQDKQVFAAISDLAVRLSAEEKVTQSTSQLLAASISDVMKDEEVNQHSRQFISDVVGDDLLQKEGGLALMQSIKYALQPGVIRVTGVTLVIVSVAFGKLMLSPY